jgi:hypothetical protein
LARLGSQRSLPALKRALRDSSDAVRDQARRSIDIILANRKSDAPSKEKKLATVPGPRTTATASRPSGPATADRQLSLRRVGHLITLGVMRNKSRLSGDHITRLLRSELAKRLGKMRGVAVLPAPADLDPSTQNEIRRRNISRLRIDGSVIQVDQRVRKGEISSRCVISLMVLDDPDMVMRAVLNGTAISTDISSSRSAEKRKEVLAKALRAAVDSALKNIDDVIEQAGSWKPNKANARKARSRRSRVALK